MLNHIKPINIVYSMTAVVSAHFSRFGKRSESVLELAAESALPIVRKSAKEIDLVIVSNSYSGEFNGISGINNLVATYLSMDDVPSMRVDNTSGSGGTAVLAAHSIIRAGEARTVLVVGVEKMSDRQTRDVTSIISSLLGERERATGASLPSLAALLATIYMRKYSATRESLAQVAVKNHRNALLNPYAHIHKAVSLDEVLSSRTIIEPLRLYEISPISDGAASLLLTSDETAGSFTDKPVYIRGTGFASDSAFITSRNELTSLESVRRAGAVALKRSGVNRPDFAELHDMATVLELVEAEALGLFKEGEAWKAVLSGGTDIGGEMPLNTSGGLNSKGHPIGASGVAQIGEVFLQLRNEAGQRQVKNAETGLALSMAGFGNSAAVTVLGV